MIDCILVVGMGWLSMSHSPWLPYLVTDYIKQLKPRSVFEWGSGESTLFFYDLGIKPIISVEHDSEWYLEIDSRLDKQGIWNVDYHLISYERGAIGSNPADPTHYKSASTQLGEVNFKSYASFIDKFGKFDLILIDGMARVSCLAHAYSHVADGGCIVLDNTGDRPYYLKQTAHLFGNWESGWETIKFMGYGPILDYKWETTIFIKRTKQDYE